MGSKAYIFGGETTSNKLAGNEVHAVSLEPTEKLEPEYSVFPAGTKDDEGAKVPSARTRHSACAFDERVAVYGGVDQSGQLIGDAPTIWLFNPAYHSWEALDSLNPETQPQPRSSAGLFAHQNNLILYGGVDTQGTLLKDTWHFDVTNRQWTPLPDAPVSSQHAALSDGVLYLISGSDMVGGDLHFLQLNAKSDEGQGWHTVPFPTTPLTPGPLPRAGAGLLPVSTGYGRQYLLYLFGAHTAGESAQASETAGEAGSAQPAYWSDIWTYQLPSSDPELKATTQIYEAMKPARIKDAIRGALGVGSGKHSWGEVEVLPPGELVPAAGKVHPGPRSSFACDVMKDKRSVAVWGGINPKGEREGDGWVIRLE